MPIPAAAAIAIPAATSLLGGMMGKEGAKSQSDAQMAGIQLTKEYRDKAFKQTQPQNIANMAATFFPGLLGPGGQTGHFAPQSNVVNTPPTQVPQGNPGAAPGGTPRGTGGIQMRAQGGPVNEGQPYIVGERGPELMVPNQSGTIVPNQNTGGGQQQNATMPPGYTQTGTNPDGTVTAWNGQFNAPQFAPGSGQSHIPQPMPHAGNQPFNTAANAPSIGGLVVNQAGQLLQNPGQVSKIPLHMSAENAGQFLNTAQQNITGYAAGSGIDPSSGVAQGLQQSASLNAAGIRNQGIRDFSMLQESMRRQDIGQGTNMYMQALQYLMGMAGQQAGALSGQFPVINNPVNPYQPLQQGLAAGGQAVADYYRQQNSPRQ